MRYFNAIYCLALQTLVCFEVDIASLAPPKNAYPTLKIKNGEHKRLLSKTCKHITDSRLLNISVSTIITFAKIECFPKEKHLREN